MTYVCMYWTVSVQSLGWCDGLLSVDDGLGFCCHRLVPLTCVYTYWTSSVQSLGWSD